MGKGGNTSWSNSCSIKCCKDCKPPKRYPGCGADCEEYKNEKQKHELRKEKERANKNKNPILGKHDFDMLQPKSERRKRKT